MNCLDYVEWIARDLEGSLPPQQSRELQAHLSQCSRCRAELLLQRTLSEALCEPLPAKLSPGFTARVVREALATGQNGAPVSVGPIVIVILSVMSAVASAVWADQLMTLLEAVPVREFFSPAVAWIVEVTGRVSGWTGNLPTLEAPTFVPALGTLEKVLAASLLGSVPLIWCFYQVYAFLRE